MTKQNLSIPESQIKWAIKNGCTTIKELFNQTKWFDTIKQLRSFLYQMKVSKKLVAYDEDTKTYRWIGE